MNITDGIEVIAFDWGGTLMNGRGADDRPMVEWEKVEALEGVAAALRELQNHFRLVVCTNAEISTAGQVRAALARVGLDGFFEAVFTPKEVNQYRKPQKEYFHQVERALGVNGNAMLMVGDDPLVDVGGAVLAGWRAVWFNPVGKAAPALLPLADAEILHWRDLQTALKQPRLPSIEQSRFWLLEQRATANLLVHVEMVAALAYQMAVWMRNSGQKVNPVLAQRGGLLHDLCKISARGTNILHGDMAADLLMEWHQNELAGIAATHMLFNLLEEAKSPRSWEEKIVYYADKLVENGRVVPFSTRMDALRQRYAMDGALVERLAEAIPSLERELTAPLGWTIEELVENLQQAFWKGR
ncbi:MAG: HAD-IIIA family hydrolase [Chloroflexota bacterium]